MSKSRNLADIVRLLETQMGFSTIADPGNAGAISVSSSGHCQITSGGAGHTRTVAIPTFEGQVLTLDHDVDGGTAIVTFASNINTRGDDKVTLTNAGDFITVKSVNNSGTLAWRVIGGSLAAGLDSILS